MIFTIVLKKRSVSSYSTGVVFRWVISFNSYSLSLEWVIFFFLFSYIFAFSFILSIIIFRFAIMGFLLIILHDITLISGIIFINFITNNIGNCLPLQRRNAVKKWLESRPFLSSFTTWTSARFPFAPYIIISYIGPPFIAVKTWKQIIFYILDI